MALQTGYYSQLSNKLNNNIEAALVASFILPKIIYSYYVVKISNGLDFPDLLTPVITFISGVLIASIRVFR